MQSKTVYFNKSTKLLLLTGSSFLVGCAIQSTPPKHIAQKIFEEKCRTLAGTKIYKKVENIDGILLLKIRPVFTNSESITKNRLLPHAAFISESGGDEHITTFLRNEVSTNSRPVSPDNRGHIVPLIRPKDRREKNDHPGYKYVDYIDPTDGRHYRYTESIEIIGQMDINAPGVQMGLNLNPNLDLNIYKPILNKTEVQAPAPRYAVTYDDHVIQEDRSNGISSSTVKVIDTVTNELLAEFTNYRIGVGFDYKFSAESWLSGRACQTGYSDAHAKTRQFVDQVLIPAK